MDVAHCLDSNVLVYAFSKAPRDAAKARVAREWISREDLGGASVQILQEFYVNAGQAEWAQPCRCARDGRGDRRQPPVIPIDVPLMRHALQLKSRYGIAYWDAVIAGAHRLGASTLVSEDLAHGQDYGSVSVFNPFAGS